MKEIYTTTKTGLGRMEKRARAYRRGKEIPALQDEDGAAHWRNPDWGRPTITVVGKNLPPRGHQADIWNGEAIATLGPVDVTREDKGPIVLSRCPSD